MIDASALLVLFGVAIVFLLFLVYLMQRRIQQLLNEVEHLGGRMQVTTSEIEALSKNVEAFKKLKI
jgi:Na+-transporting methylmalonyl-CoA/oxaloacetate decarboxylase gamma subunit